MRKFLKKLGLSLLSFSLLFSAQTISPKNLTFVQAAGSARIHYLTLPDNTEAILLENNGQFGMVDSGEDNDYPTGSDSRYPYRTGIIQGNGFENEVISYMRSVGVTTDNFEFYIGTHPHSDHIGSADEVIRAFHPKRVYIQEYKDSYVSSSGNLWDNLYVYDHMIAAAQEVGATIIQNFDPAAPLYPEQVNVTGHIQWNDGEDQDGIRPQNVSVTLTNPVTNETRTQTITPDASGIWSYSFDGLLKYDNTKSLINYTVSLSVPDGYTVSSENSFDFLCSHTPATKNEILTVNWDDAATRGKKRPASLEVEIQKQVVLSVDSAEPVDPALEEVSAEPSLAPAAETVTWETVSQLTMKPDETGAWSVTAEHLQKNDENGNPVIYRLNILSSSDDYTFTADEGSFTINAVYIGSEFPQESGIQDASPLDGAKNSGTSDGMTTASIPSADKVDPENPADPNNLGDGFSASARTGKYDTLSQTQNTTSTPVFTLGGDMQIEIKHYGGDYKTSPKPDANYFSLGVLVKANGKSAFLSGDINNYEGAETALANDLQHVDLLTLGHHGYYGSNTSSFVTKLNPQLLVLAGTYSAVSNITSPNGEQSTLNLLLAMGSKNVPLYVTGWYHNLVDALVFNFDSSFSNNIPRNQSFIAGAMGSQPPEYIYYRDGLPTPSSGWATSNGYTFYFDNSYYATKDKWIKDSAGRYSYLTADGKMAVGWIPYNSQWYYMDSNGYMKTGWVKDSGNWYYMDSSGAMTTGPKTIDGISYHFHTNGVMVTSAWANGKYYGPDGKWIPNYKNANWRKDDKGWWYQKPDGTYPVNKFELIDGSWYYFNASGYMVTGWLKSGSTWYYMDANGIMQTGWLKQKGAWYYLGSDGSMKTGWTTIGGSLYYFTPGNGAMVGPGWHWINGKCYYMYASGAVAVNTWIGNDYVDSSGAWQEGYTNAPQWVKSKNRWWYRHADGSYTRSNWELIGGKWYYFDASGWMKTGWLKLGNTWYYLSDSGAMLGKGWHWINGKCYYMYASGAMAANTWIGDSYVNSSGVWVKNATRSARWIKDGNRWWYRHANGSYTRSNWELIGGKWYYFDASGWMKTGWLKLGSTWYYLSDSGAMLGKGWHKINGKSYYMYASGAMAVNTRIDGYYVDASGAWVPGK